MGKISRKLDLEKRIMK